MSSTSSKRYATHSPSFPFEVISQRSSSAFVLETTAKFTSIDAGQEQGEGCERELGPAV